ncbi:putative effector protein [Ceratobasidium theobromae]|uniref:Putative effector protein n=1 Tax=Ceratobasidium theobromae TaxID=1582974 RepID=A0A5N5Q617_9AGAM|nr:putative effector protein [Ceratobasidium theobromae]
MLANFPTIVVVVLGGLATAIPLANPSVPSSREYRSIAARQGAEGGNNKGLFAAKRTHRCYSNDDPKHPEPCHGGRDIIDTQTGPTTLNETIPGQANEELSAVKRTHRYYSGDKPPQHNSVGARGAMEEQTRPTTLNETSRAQGNEELSAVKRSHHCFGNIDRDHPEPCHGEDGPVHAGVHVVIIGNIDFLHLRRQRCRGRANRTGSVKRDEPSPGQ